MIVLYIVGALAVLAAILIASPLSFRIRAGSGGVRVDSKYLFFCRSLYPGDKKPADVKKKKGKKAPAEKKKPAERKRAGSEDFLSQLKTVASVFSELFSKLRKRLRIKLNKLCVVVATGDAANTAYLYASACNVCDELLFSLSQFMHFSEADGAVDISCDFEGEHPSAELDLSVRISALGAIGTLFPMLAKILKQKG